MDGKRYISFLLISCFSVFLGHNLIPHHHHAEQVSVPLATECQEDHQDTHNHPPDSDHEPLHCHAFNDVVFDKYSSLHIQKEYTHILTCGFPSNISKKDPHFKEASLAYMLFKIPDKPSDYFGARSLRAPPLA